MSSEIMCDVVVLGAGAAGMTTASVAASQGLDVIVVEKTEYVGGNTSFSGGMVYIPNNDKMSSVGLEDSRQDAMTYLDLAVPISDGREMRERFVQFGRQAIQYLEENTSVDLKPVAFYPDYYPELEGSREGARCLEPEPFDASTLGSWFKKLRPPIPEFTILGGMMVSREDLPHFRNAFRSPRAFFRVASLVCQYALQRIRYHRGSRLVLGNALAGQLLKSLLDQNIKILTETKPIRIEKSDGKVTGVVASGPDGDVEIRASVGVVVTTGGFSKSDEKRSKYLPSQASKLSPFAPGSTGDGLDLGVSAGGLVGADNVNNAYWSPTSIYQRDDGRTVVYPHTVTDRGKPGSIVVNKAGRRFTNEAVSYHQFGEALISNESKDGNLPAWIIADSNFIWKYGLGAIIPFVSNLKPFQKTGYLKSADSLDDLAKKIGVDKIEFGQTISQFNTDAYSGKDTKFSRGENVYSKYLGDAENTPNPCLAPLLKAPFHAIELVLSDLGTVAGLKVDNNCQVLDEQGDVIEGLFATGNDMQSIMRGRYPGPGITLGPALTFGYLLGTHLVSLHSGSTKSSTNY